ncbi:uncharacterized protein LOC133033875 [Cannabis sativa]|uniref:uncharacterized protein LOC133033875 n=1 Tax=Cannabis sativa TaxID=3483 RepID=UPI0029C9FD8C|nr:uncharacterized protein LOC133033875 [Cannabis sativa]
MDYEDVSQCVKLYSDNIDNVVAEGVIIEAVGYFSYHGDIITNDYARVQITQVIQGEAEIPYPRGAIRYVCDACNKLVPWPRELILTEEGSLIKKLHSSNNSKGKEKCKGKEKIVEHLDSTKSYEKFIAGVLDKTHISLQAMFLEYMRVKGKNEFVRIPVNPSLFYRVHIYITSEDVIQVATQDELTGSAMLFGLRCIWENLNQRQKELYKFYDIELLSYNNEQDKVIAINQLSIWLNTMTHVGQYYFIPWNIGKHWMLIIAMTSGRVVFLNPLKSKIPSDIAQMIKAAYANISSNAIVFGKNGPEIWTFACPKQPYNYECGYYVLTYIRDMLQHSNPIEAIKAKFGGLSQYSEDDHLLPLRQQWLSQLLPLIYKN